MSGVMVGNAVRGACGVRCRERGSATGAKLDQLTPEIVDVVMFVQFIPPPVMGAKILMLDQFIPELWIELEREDQFTPPFWIGAKVFIFVQFICADMTDGKRDQFTAVRYVELSADKTEPFPLMNPVRLVGVEVVREVMPPPPPPPQLTFVSEGWQTRAEPPDPNLWTWTAPIERQAVRTRRILREERGIGPPR